MVENRSKSDGLVHKSDGTYQRAGDKDFHISSNPDAKGDDGSGRDSDGGNSDSDSDSGDSDSDD